MDAAKNRIMSGLPFLSQKLPAKYDGLGNLQTRYDNPVLGFFNTFINPGAFNRIQANEIADNLEALGDKSVYPEYLAPKSFQVDGETVMVSGKEMTETYQKTYGDNITALYGGLMESEDFRKLTKEQQIAALKQAKTYATQFAKAAVSDFDDIPVGTAEELTKAIIQKVAAAEMTDAFTAITQAWREGYADDSEARESLENAFSVFDGLSPEMQKAVTEASSGRLEAYMAAKKKGVDTDTFLALYRQYWDIGESGKTANEKAHDWAYALEKAVESRTITEAQKNALKQTLTISSGFTVETEKFDQLTESGLSADEAQDLGWLIQGLKIQEGYKEVRPVQKAEAIAGSSLSEADKIAALKIYGTDAQDENLDLMLDAGYSAKDYVTAWLIYSREEAKGGRGTKNRTIQAFMEQFKVDRATAAAIYDIYG